MLNRSKQDNKFGGSKGFGFVEFSEHAHALKALRHLNNNPDVFTPDRRPIVEFSVENMVALNRKKYRVIKSQKMQAANSSGKDGIVSKSVPLHLNEKHLKKNGDQDQSEISYSGVQSKPPSKDDKVVMAKTNRKMRQVKKDLKKRAKKLKGAKARQENSEKHKLKLTKKEIRKKIAEENGSKGKKKLEETDKFDQHYRKRKNVFLSQQNNEQTPAPQGPKVKKTKWFS